VTDSTCVWSLCDSSCSQRFLDVRNLTTGNASTLVRDVLYTRDRTLILSQVRAFGRHCERDALLGVSVRPTRMR
jgi:hypothetical protein